MLAWNLFQLRQGHHMIGLFFPVIQTQKVSSPKDKTIIGICWHIKLVPVPFFIKGAVLFDCTKHKNTRDGHFKQK